MEKGRESGFVAHCPVLKGCVSQGTTERKALANLREAMQNYLETLAEDGLPLPTEEGRHYIDLDLPDFYQEQILAQAAKLTQPEILKVLLQIHRKYSSQRHPTEDSQMCMLWPDDIEIIEGTDPMNEIEETFGIYLEEEVVMEIYDMNAIEASQRIASLIKPEQEQTDLLLKSPRLMEGLTIAREEKELLDFEDVFGRE